MGSTPISATITLLIPCLTVENVNNFWRMKNSQKKHHQKDDILTYAKIATMSMQGQYGIIKIKTNKKRHLKNGEKKIHYNMQNID